MTKDETLSELKSYLENQVEVRKKIHSHTDWKYISFEELILDCGIVMEAKALPKDIEQGLPQSCYHNCQELAFKRKDLTYLEGYALSVDIPIPLPHAWLLTLDKKAIDPTWETPGTAYLGVPLSTKWVKTLIKSRQDRGRDERAIFESNYLEGFSLFKEGLPHSAINL